MSIQQLIPGVGTSTGPSVCIMGTDLTIGRQRVKCAGGLAY